ncbi:hypothetical protein [Haloarchaeobius sp. TZWSO28]|uniref:hypothetical protein n=1 Tax=unclassified Haloarchaeobius TaxID=2614452 RepID=UPI003EC10E56
MPGESHDPTDIRSIAVHADDVVTALEASQQGREAVLRITAPFAGRVRARIHLVQPAEPADDGGGGPGPIRIPPGRLVAEGAPAYPHAHETEPDGEYDVEAHHERHAEELAAWREAVREHFLDSIELDLPTGPHRVDVKVLG